MLVSLTSTLIGSHDWNIQHQLLNRTKFQPPSLDLTSANYKADSFQRHHSPVIGPCLAAIIH